MVCDLKKDITEYVKKNYKNITVEGPEGELAYVDILKMVKEYKGKKEKFESSGAPRNGRSSGSMLLRQQIAYSWNDGSREDRHFTFIHYHEATTFYAMYAIMSSNPDVSADYAYEHAMTAFAFVLASSMAGISMGLALANPDSRPFAVAAGLFAIAIVSTIGIMNREEEGENTDMGDSTSELLLKNKLVF